MKDNNYKAFAREDAEGREEYYRDAKNDRHPL